MPVGRSLLACGTALSIRQTVAARRRPLEPDEVEGVSRGAMTFAATLTGEDYLEALETVHAYGRQMARFFLDWDILLTPTLAEPPARIGR